MVLPTLKIEMGDGFRLIDGMVEYKNSKSNKVETFPGITLEKDIYKIDANGQRLVDKTTHINIYLSLLPNLLQGASTLYDATMALTSYNDYEDFCEFIGDEELMNANDPSKWKSSYDFSSANARRVPLKKIRIDKETFITGEIVTLQKVTIESITLARNYVAKDKDKTSDEKSTFAISFPFNLLESFYFGLCAIAKRRNIDIDE